MKKIILLSFIGFVLLSCSKNDDVDTSNQELPKTWDNFVGKWKLSQIKRPNGTIDTYVPLCAGKECILDIDVFGNTKETYYDIDCIERGESAVDGFIDSGDGQFSFVADIIETGKPVSVTSNKFVVEWENYTFYYPYAGNAKQLIFVRK